MRVLFGSGENGSCVSLECLFEIGVLDRRHDGIEVRLGFDRGERRRRLGGEGHCAERQGGSE